MERKKDGGIKEMRESEKAGDQDRLGRDMTDRTT